jgi:hypothetical protein
MNRREVFVGFTLLLPVLASCSDGDGGGEDDRRCVIIDNTLVLRDGQSCVLSSEQQSSYRLQGFDEPSCSQGRLLLGPFNSGGGADLNGLLIRCELPTDAGAAAAPSPDANVSRAAMAV